ncbi:MAG: metallophosphoesterase [Actinobacteria bacterium]|nr:metallophosphoesterase [Actinomycetota bacterium]
MNVAAVGDVHIGTDSVGRLAQHLREVDQHADVLLLAGDLSRRGGLDEARVVVGELAEVTVPVVAVFGNHEFESDLQDEFRAVLEDAGVTVLEGESTVIDVDGQQLGIAGTVGFGGGFPGATCADFGEAEMKHFVARSRDLASTLEQRLRDLADARVATRIALLHYSPVRDTLTGEHPELYPFLGSHWLADAADRAGADLVVHGHAHHGVERGVTPGGIPVRNVAQPVIRRPYAVYRVGEGSDVDHTEQLTAR